MARQFSIERRRNSWLFLVVGLLCVVGVAAAALLARNADAWVYVEQAPDRFFRIFNARGNEYFFLLGLLLIFWAQALKRQWILATISVLIGAWWLVFSESLVFWLTGLGADSFSEAQDFDFSEAIFFVGTLSSILSPIFPFRRLIVYVVLGVVLLWSLERARRALGVSRPVFLRILQASGFLIIVLTLGSIAAKTFRSAVDNTALYRQATENFNHSIKPVTFNNRLKVVVYIGESTSAMNFGIYGYPRATTPELQRLRSENPGLLVFDHVMATYTHTSQSLLETLSIGLDPKQDVIPILSRQRLSLVDLLAESHVPTFLLSNQGETGTWNMASRIVFRKAERTYSVQSGAAGNADYKIARPDDLSFFTPQLDALLGKLPVDSPAAIFLHSYAGHGTVDGYIGALPPAFRDKVDDFLTNRMPVQIFGDVVNQPLVTKLTEGVEQYDSAMRYVDFAISQVIAQVSKVDQPVVYIYFSDHGESSFTASGHESSRFKLEMGRVPFVMYFNSAARRQYPDLFAKYRDLAASGAISTLAQVPATIIDLLGGRSQVAAELPSLTGVVGEPAAGQTRAVVVRSTSSGDTFVSLSGAESITSPLAQDGKLTNAADDATRVYVAREMRALAPTLLCYGNANTLAAALRGAYAAQCVGIGLLHHGADGFTTNLGQGKPLGPDLASMLRITATRNTMLWADATSAGLPGSCEALGRALTSDGQAARRVVAFPPGAPAPGTPLMDCASHLHKLGLRVALQVDTGPLLACASNSSASAGVCASLDADLQATIASGNFTDLAYEQRGQAGMRKLKSAMSLPQTLTGVAAPELLSIKPGSLYRVVVNPVDANTVR